MTPAVSKTKDTVVHLDEGQKPVGVTDWTRMIQTVGFPAVGCLAIAWFAYSTVEWERSKMLPALEANAKAIEVNSEVLRTLPAIFRKEAKADRDDAAKK